MRLCIEILLRVFIKGRDERCEFNVFLLKIVKELDKIKHHNGISMPL